jgi:hypothetical protein
MELIIRALCHVNIICEFTANADTSTCIYLKQQIKFTHVLHPCYLQPTTEDFRLHFFVWSAYIYFNIKRLWILTKDCIYGFVSLSKYKVIWRWWWWPPSYSGRFFTQKLSLVGFVKEPHTAVTSYFIPNEEKKNSPL